MQIIRLCVVAAALLPMQAMALRLTGINGFPTDAAGAWHTGWYNTYGSQEDVGKNAYVILSADKQGAFINSANDVRTSIDVELSGPGEYKFLAFFDGVEIYSGRDFWGLNLFFDGDPINPGISAFGIPVSAGEQSVFWANSNLTKTLSGGDEVWGSGSLAYQTGNVTVSLTSYATYRADAFGLDRVDNFRLGSSGRNDHVTEFTLQVVPEPTSCLALAAGLGLLRIRSRRR